MASNQKASINLGEFNWKEILQAIGELNSLPNEEVQLARTQYFSTIENFAKSSPPVLFPDPIWKEIMKLMDGDSLFSLSHTCRKLRLLASGTFPSSK